MSRILAVIFLLFVCGCGKNGHEQVVESSSGIEVVPGLTVDRSAAQKLMCECACQYGFIMY